MPGLKKAFSSVSWTSLVKSLLQLAMKYSGPKRREGRQKSYLGTWPISRPSRLRTRSHPEARRIRTIQHITGRSRSTLLTHLPYRSWCPICLKVKGKAIGHWSRELHRDASFPVISVDYCFLCESGEVLDDETEGDGGYHMQGQRGQITADHRSI